MSSNQTVKIVDKNKDGDFIIIRESDYDKTVHTLFNDKPKKTQKKRVSKDDLKKRG